MHPLPPTTRTDTTVDMNDYQNKAAQTAIYPADQGLTYTILGLASESGELAGKLKKIIRDKGGHLTMADRVALAYELGDTLWYAAMVAKELGTTLGTIAEMNVDKLADRAQRDRLQGDGDDR